MAYKGFPGKQACVAIAVQKEWDNITFEQINGWIEPMPERIKATKESQGMATRFEVAKVFQYLSKYLKTKF